MIVNIGIVIVWFLFVCTDIASLHFDHHYHYLSLLFLLLVLVVPYPCPGTVHQFVVNHSINGNLCILATSLMYTHGQEVSLFTCIGDIGRLIRHVGRSSCSSW